MNEFTSATEAAKATGASSEAIGRVCNGRRGTTNGLFFTWKNSFDHTSKEKPSIHGNMKAVQQLAADGSVERQFVSVDAALKELGLSGNSISNVCNGRQESTNGRRFRWVDSTEADGSDSNSFVEGSASDASSSGSSSGSSSASSESTIPMLMDEQQPLPVAFPTRVAL